VASDSKSLVNHNYSLLYNDITKAVDKILQVDVAILSIRQGNIHSGLLYKLDHYGVRGNLLNWLKSFLSDRSQQVAEDGI